MALQKKATSLFILILTALSLMVTTAAATEEFAGQTGQDCQYCHVNSSGGGELTEAGQGFSLSLLEPSAENGASASSGQRLSASYFVRLVAGSLHILFGFFWFGTILYVHLVLKPAYASGGLPRGEVRIGLLSMLIMAVSGTILFVYRVPSAEFLLTTRFGILLLIKIVLFLIMVSSALFVVLYIGPRLKQKKAAPSSAGTGDMTREELAGFDGKEGRPAYIAYNDGIYDVTGSPLWTNGSHLGRHPAGCDLTEVLEQAPHGKDKVLAMPHVGTLVGERSSTLTLQQKVFFFMAYMNLSFVLVIVLILALWKWL